MKEQSELRKLEEKLRRYESELAEAYAGWDHSEIELQKRIDFLLAGITALQDMLQEATSENWEMAQFLAELLAENFVLGQRVKEQRVVIAKLSVQLDNARPKVL